MPEILLRCSGHGARNAILRGNPPDLNSKTQMKVLLSTYACNPGTGSESGLGWNWVLQIARFHQVWVLTQTKERHRIEDALARKPIPNTHWIFCDLPPWARFRKRGHWGENLDYYMWQLWAYGIARRLHKQVQFDLVHHVTFVRYWMPSFLALLPVPLIWGPVGSGDSAPPGFVPNFSFKGRFAERARTLARCVCELDPFVRLTARRAVCAFAATNATQERMKGLGCIHVAIQPESALSVREIEWLGNLPPPNAERFRVLSIGRLIPSKAFDLSLRAFAAFHRSFPNSEYWLIGDGPERARLAKIALVLEVDSHVRFWGTLPREQVLEKLSECSVLVHPSLRESGGWVCLEAMAAARPVVCLNWAGPGVQVTPDTGIKINVSSPEQVVREMAAALVRLAADAELCRRLGQRGRERVAEHFNWERKGNLMEQVYQFVLAAAAAQKVVNPAALLQDCQR